MTACCSARGGLWFQRRSSQQNSCRSPEMSTTSKVFNLVGHFTTHCIEDRVKPRIHSQGTIITDLTEVSLLSPRIPLTKGLFMLLLIDYFSKYPEVVKLNSATSGSIITASKSIFSGHGVPDVLVSVNGPQYASQEFASFAK